jgi:predicted enzyme related to lactoylglutathione lyase
MNRVFHFEMVADRPQDEIKFYQDVFGWEFKQVGQDYWLVTTGEDSQPGINGGLATKRSGVQNRVTNSIDVSSIDDTTAKIEKAGGIILQPKQEVPGFGYLAVCKDPQNIVFGVVQRVPQSPFTEPFK